MRAAYDVASEINVSSDKLNEGVALLYYTVMCRRKTSFAALERKNRRLFYTSGGRPPWGISFKTETLRCGLSHAS